jgi:hypothetical protein
MPCSVNISSNKGNFQSCRSLQIAAANGDFSSYIDLAKYFEHEVRDIKSAIHWTNLGQSLISNNQSLKNARLEKELQKRVNRLQAKEGNHVSKEN